MAKCFVVECTFCIKPFYFAEKHKSHLMELIHKRHMTHHVFKIDIERSNHASKYRSDAYVSGEYFTCKQTFDRKRDSVHDVCRLALELLTIHISTKTRHPSFLPVSPPIFMGLLWKKNLWVCDENAIISLQK